MDGSITKEGAGAGIFINSPNGQTFKFAVKFNFHVSNNEAEYEAFIRSLNILADLGAQHIVLHLDSQLVIQQMLGTYERKEERMIAYAKQAEELLKKFHKVDICPNSSRGICTSI